MREPTTLMVMVYLHKVVSCDQIKVVKASSMWVDKLPSWALLADLSSWFAMEQLHEGNTVCTSSQIFQHPRRLCLSREMLNRGTAENGKPWLLLSWWWGFVRSKHWHSDAPVRRALAAEATPGWWQASGRVHPFPEEQGSRSLPALPSRLVYIPAGSGWAGVSQCKTVSEKTSPASPPT